MRFPFGFFFLVISLVLSFMRIHGSKGEIFQAIAHVLVGLILGFAVSSSISYSSEYVFISWSCFVILCIVEVVCFVLQHKPTADHVDDSSSS